MKTIIEQAIEGTDRADERIEVIDGPHQQRATQRDPAPLQRRSCEGPARELRAAMDRTVLDSYGWSDIPTDSNFLLDYEINDEEWARRRSHTVTGGRDEVRDEVLARLLELNAERAKEEALSGAAAVKKDGKNAPALRAPKSTETGERRLNVDMLAPSWMASLPSRNGSTIVADLRVGPAPLRVRAQPLSRRVTGVAPSLATPLTEVIYCRAHLQITVR